MGRLGKLRDKLADRLHPLPAATSSVHPPAAIATPSPTNAVTPAASTSSHASDSAIAAASTASTSTTAAASTSTAALTASSSATPPTASANAAAAALDDVASTNAPAFSSTTAAHASPTPTHPPFPVMRLVENASSSKSSTPRRVYVSLSSDLRLINLKPTVNAPSSLLEFRSPDFRMILERLPDAPPPDPALSITAHLEAVVESRVCVATHAAGPAVRVCDASRRAIVLVADTEDERDAFLLALRLRVAPWALLVVHMKEEMVSARAQTTTSPSLADAAREFFAGKAGETGAAEEMRTAGVVRRVWEKAGKVAETSMWAATFAQGIAGVSKTAEEVEKLAKLLGGLTLVGCAFSLVALSARAVNLISLERKGRRELGKAGDDLRETSLSLVRWLFSILGSGFRDEQDGLVDGVFGVLGKCWMVAQELEEYLFGSWVARSWSAEDVRLIVTKVDSLKEKLFGVGLLKVVAGLQEGHVIMYDQVQKLDKKIIDLKVPAFDQFHLPAQTQTERGAELVPGAATCLSRLKAAILPSRAKNGLPSKGGADEFSPGRGSLRLPRVALTSISGEGGVGKTSTCRLLCRDSIVRKHFSGGAVVWIDVGKSATEVKVKREIQRNVSKFGGKRSAEEVRSADSVLAAVEIASEFFSGICILVVIDNVWETPVGSILKSWTSVLAQIASYSGSAVIATTRSSSLARGAGFDQLQLVRLDLTSDSSPDWRIAEDLYNLLLKATVDTQSTALYKKIRKQALVLSCGLLLGIMTFASLVQSYCEIGDDAEAVLSKIEKRIFTLGGRDVGEDAKATVGHPGVFAAMNECLTFLDERKGCHVKFEPLLTPGGKGEGSCRTFSSSYARFSAQAFTSRYAALHMLQASSVAISFSLLCHLWHVATIDEAKDIARRFVDIGLARVEGKGEKCFALHDLQYEFCGLSRGSLTRGALAGDASEICDPVSGHALFLSSCKSLLLSKYGNADVSWALFCFGDSTSSDSALREYLRQNLVRHLCSAEPDQVCTDPEKCSPAVHVLSVLCDFWWLLGRLGSNLSRSSLLRDFHFAFESGFLSENDTHFLHKLRETLMQVRQEDVVQSDGTLASSLVQLAQSVVAENVSFPVRSFEQVSKSAVEKVVGAWLKPVSGCVLSFEPTLLKKAAVSSTAILYLSPLGDGKHFVSLSADGAVRILDYSNMDTVLVLQGLVEVESIAVVQQGQTESSYFILTSDSNGVLRCSKITLNEAAVTSDGAGALAESNRVSFGESDSPTSCLSASQDGKVVAVCSAESGNGIVSIWELYCDSPASYMRSNSFNCSFDEAGECWVKHAVVSKSGLLVATCSSDGYLAFWGKESAFSRGNWKRVARLEKLVSDNDYFEIHSILISNDETDLIILFSSPPAYEVWDLEAGERRFSRVELPDLNWIICAALAGSGDGGEFEPSLLIGGRNADGFVAVEFLIGDGIEKVGMYPLVAWPTVICPADYSNETGLSGVIVGDLDGRVYLLKADSFDARKRLRLRESGMRAEETRSPELDNVGAVAVMAEARLVVAGHDDGRLSLWSAEVGTFVIVIDNETEADNVFCIDISADESVAVSGHKNGTAIVWETSTWTVRCALDGDSGYVACVAVLTDANRVFTVVKDGECRVWDAERGGAALSVIETRAKFLPGRSRGFVSSDGGHFIWAAGGPDSGGFLLDDPWKAKVIDTVDGRVVFESGEHWQWDELCVEVDLHLSPTEGIRSWKRAAVIWNERCELRVLEKESGIFWEISAVGSSNVQCPLRGSQIAYRASIDLGSPIYSIEAQWLPHPGEDGRRRAVVACTLSGKKVPAIMHFITPKV